MSILNSILGYIFGHLLIKMFPSDFWNKPKQEQENREFSTEEKQVESIFEDSINTEKEKRIQMYNTILNCQMIIEEAIASAGFNEFSLVCHLLDDRMSLDVFHNGHVLFQVFVDDNIIGFIVFNRGNFKKQETNLRQEESEFLVNMKNTFESILCDFFSTIYYLKICNFSTEENPKKS